MPLKVLALNCTLKSSPEKSSTEKMLSQLLDAFGDYDAKGEIVRVADLDIKAGVSADEGEGDDWPTLRKRVLERMDAFLDEKDDMQRMPTYGKVGLCAVVGNEDGAHHVSAEVCQALAEVGFTIPTGGVTYWVGEAMGSTDYIDLKETPKVVAEWTPVLASNAAHLAGLLKKSNYPGRKEKK